MKRVAPYGTWRSPVTLGSLVEDAVRLADAEVHDGRVYFVETRPSDQGRSVLVREDGSGGFEDVVPSGFSVRTTVHEYGGRAYGLRDGVVFFSNYADQRLYRLEPGQVPVALTDEPATARAVRFGAPCPTPDGRWILCVRERHLASGVVNDLVAIPTTPGGEPVTVARGHDFYGAPACSPDGGVVAFVAWDHPSMPWDSTVLYESELAPDSGALFAPAAVAGGDGVSVGQPRYSPAGVLHFVSDESGWSNLYRRNVDGIEAIHPSSAEFSGPDWVLGLRSYAFYDDGTLVCTWRAEGADHLGVLDADVLVEVPGPLSAFSSLATRARRVVCVAGSPAEASAVVEIDPADASVEVLRPSRPAGLEEADVSRPVALSFATGGGEEAHALFYPPTNAAFEAPAGELAPLIVMSHGGPTSAASSVLDARLQFWTTRGFAVVDVDYGGSTGYGRAYRERLKGGWGLVDVEDCVNAARHLAATGLVDGRRMVMRGSSAGGFTTLCALTSRDDFAAGASLYGIADLAVLAAETHKFEARYMDGLVGPWPEARALYAERSPLAHVDRLATPLIMLQGLEDAVVPPAQAEAMAAALDRRAVPYALVLFPGEQHGFRRAETIVRAAAAELYFYGRVLGFEPADELEPVEIHHAEALGRA